jgi:hypothetical protein
VHEEVSHTQEREKISRALQGLDNLGIQISAAGHLTDRAFEPEKCAWLDDVMPDSPKSGLRQGGSETGTAGASPDAQILGTFVEAFLQSFNHFLFLFSEYELRESFDPYKWTSDASLPIDVCLVLALGAKASIFQVEDIQNEWYRRARLRLLSEDRKDDMWMMRTLTLICLFEIDNDIDVSYSFLSSSTSGRHNGRRD